jgi:hypothetical protein
MSEYRVFISYRHDDVEKVEILADILRKNGLEPMWTPDIRAGSGFTQEIMDFIAHSHIFVPFITKDSIERGWVNQEIGYAKALNIPILPISLDELPPGMISDLQAVKWDDNQIKMKDRLSCNKFNKIIESTKTKPLFECGYLFHERTQMIADFSKRIRYMGSGYHGHVRQKSRLSSFQIPDKPINDEIWQERDKVDLSETSFKLLRKERQELEKHVAKCGFSLIIDPNIAIKENGAEIAKVRIGVLLDFLNEIKNENTKIVMDQGKIDQNLTMVGDWFAALAAVQILKKGSIKQTIFTRHAPTLRKLIETFDNEIDGLLSKQKLSANESKNYAIGQLEELQEKL